MSVVRKNAASAAAVSRKPMTKGSASVPANAEKTTGKRKRLADAFPRPLEKKLDRVEVVRDCFSFPETEYAHLVALKKRLMKGGMDIKKSELLRAGLALLTTLDDRGLKELLSKVPRVS